MNTGTSIHSTVTEPLKIFFNQEGRGTSKKCLQRDSNDTEIFLITIFKKKKLEFKHIHLTFM